MTPAPPPPALETRGLVRRFGGLLATDHVDLTIPRGARHALIGPNGAGKTTLINLLTGVVAPSAGTVLLEGHDVTRLPVHARVARGLARTFQINQLFPDMTPLEAIALAVTQRLGRGGRMGRAASADREAMDEAGALGRQFGLGPLLDRPTRVLSYGKQRLLEIAIAFACRPRVLLLDEPAAGVPEEERHEILAILGTLPEEVSIVLIEHDMDLVFRFATTITVLVAGAVLVEGGVEAVADDARVRRVYLGEG